MECSTDLSYRRRNGGVRGWESVTGSEAEVMHEVLVWVTGLQKSSKIDLHMPRP